MLMEESEIKKSNKNYKKTNIQLSDLSNKNYSDYPSSHSDFSSTTTLNILPNSKINKLLIISTLFNFLVLLAVIIYSFFNKNYILNISYLEKNSSNNKNNNTEISQGEINNDFISIFSINIYMFYIILFILLLFEFVKITFIMFRKNCKKLSKFIYLEMGYWFIFLKFSFGLNLLLMCFLIFNFYLNFVISILLTVITISKNE